MDDKDKAIAELKGLIFNFGEAIVGLIEETLACEFKDRIGRELINNRAFIACGEAVEAAAVYAQQKGIKYGNP